MKYTNLQLVQMILSALDSDEVNSVSETVESRQILQCIQTAFFDIVSLGELPNQRGLYQLQASGDIDLPILMYLPDDVTHMEWLKYDNQTAENANVNYQPVYPMELADFITMATSMDPDAANTQSYTISLGNDTFTLYCGNDRAPRYYTAIGDYRILFDSYDAEVDTTLQNSKTMAFGEKTVTWSNTDNFIPPLDDKASQRLLHEAKALAFAELKQTPHMKAEKMARDIKIDQQASKYKAPLQTDYDLIPNLGRQAPMGRIKPNGRYK